MRTALFLLTLLSAACTDGPATPDPVEVPLAEGTAEVLGLATQDATRRVLPTLSEALPGSELASLDQALVELATALDGRSAPAAGVAAAELAGAVSAAGGSSLDANHPAAVDLAALDILAAFVHDAVAQTPGGTP